MEEIIKTKIKKGFYDGLKEVDLFYPKDTVWIKDDTYIGGSPLHTGAFHYIGITRSNDNIIKECSKNCESLEYYTPNFFGSGEKKLTRINDYIILCIYDMIDINNQLNLVSEDVFNKSLKIDTCHIVKFNLDGVLISITHLERIIALNCIYTSKIFYEKRFDNSINWTVKCSCIDELFSLSSNHKEKIVLYKDNLGEDLFNSMLGEAISKIGYKQTNSKYDLDYIEKVYSKCIENLENIRDIPASFKSIMNGNELLPKL